MSASSMDATTSASPSTSLAIFVTWCQSNKIWIDPRIELRHVEPTGVGVYALSSIDAALTVVSIPKNRVFSTKSCSDSAFLEQVRTAVTQDATLLLSLALVLELQLGNSSPWWGYFQTFPRSADLAVFWQVEAEEGKSDDSRNAMEWLKATELVKHISIATKFTVPALDSFYDKVMEVENLPQDRPISIEQLYHAFSLVSSRAFQVDAYHKVALVPIADAFNHVEENTVHLETDYFVCEHCGSLDECPHDEDPLSSRLLKSDYIPSMSTSPGEEIDTCEMATNAVIMPGDELYNSYDAGLDNARLMIQYGFLLEGNGNEKVEWGRSELLVRDEAEDGDNGDSKTGLPSDKNIDVMEETMELWARLANEFLPLEEMGLDELIFNPQLDSQTPSARQSHPYSSDEDDDAMDSDSNPDSHPKLVSTAYAQSKKSNFFGAMGPEDLLCVSASGQVSQQLWLYFVFRRGAAATFGSDSKLAGSEAGIPSSVRALAELRPRLLDPLAVALSGLDEEDDTVMNVSAPNTRDVHALGFLAWLVAEDIINLCRRRISLMHMGHLSTVEVGNLLESMNASTTPRTRLACMFALNERMMLESCLAQWEDVNNRSITVSEG
ncbi:SET domain-containing protein [Clavulina sp. PMI_390]|nr:SET domain-containing protein [Clavulina sp. PMI_390]